ncbi:MAG TPA: metallopeptidase family protein [Longimicrobiales bacterium]
MRLAEFEQRARAIWEDIPAQYKEGVDGLVVEADIHTHPEHADFFTLGECVTEAYPSDYGGPDNIRSAVVLYYGSFEMIAQDDEQFDWDREINETILHELQHHLESLADADQLTDLDYAVEQNFQRVEGQSFDPLFYRGGEEIAVHTYRVEDDVFVEVEATTFKTFDHEFDWQGARYRVAIPASEADVLYVILEQELPDVAGELSVVRVRRRGVLGTLRAAWSARGTSVEQTFATARPT